jgi:ABC-2 type transport system permease protein
MRFMELAIRNFKEMYRDLLSLGLTIVFPPALLLVFSPLAKFGGIWAPTMITPGIVLLGFAMITMSAALILARDRESALLSRLLTAPLRANDFISAYSLPYIPVAIIQMGVVFAIGRLLGLEISGNAGLVFLVLFVMSLGFIGMGMLLGALFTEKQLGAMYAPVILLVVFGGAWVPLEVMGGVFQSIMNAFPFAHALDATRDIMVHGAGFSDIATDFYWVLGYTLVFFTLGIFLFRRRMLE